MKTTGLLILLMLSSMLMSGCGTVIQEVKIQDAKVSGPMNCPPIHVTMDSTKGLVRISPGFSVHRKRLLTEKIDSESSQDPAKQYDLQWSLPDYTLGLGFDFGLGRSGSLTLGGEYGNVDGHDSWNGYLGIGFHDAGPAMGFRMDFGLLLRNLRHDAYTVVITKSDFAFFGSSVDKSFYHDCGNDNALDFYAQMTLNTKVKRSPVNLFVSTGILRQTLLKYHPSTTSELWFGIPVSVPESSADATYRVVFLSLTPGVTFNFTDRYTLLVGGMIVAPLSNDLKPKTVVSPFMQLDFAL
jgi:hypothetical protein